MLKVYGSGLVEVTRNGVQLSQETIGALGAVGWSTSPREPLYKHSIFELKIPAQARRIN